MEMKLIQTIERLENELEEYGYRMKFSDLLAAAEYIIEYDYEITEYIEDTIGDSLEFLIKL